jgi:PAS domain S-box-containing protein
MTRAIQQIEQAPDLHVGDDLFHAVFRNASIGVKVVDVGTGRLVEANTAFQQMVGFEIEELRARLYADFTHPDDRERDRVAHSHILDGSTDRFNLVKRYLRKDGSAVPARVTASVVRDEHGLARFGISMVEDISSEVEAESARRGAEERYRLIVETTMEGVWTIDAEGKTTFANDAMATMLGRSADDLLGRHIFEFLDEEGTRQAADSLERRRRGESDQFITRFIRADGSTIETILSSNSLFDDEGRYVGALAMVLDDTELRLSRETLGVRVRQLETIAELGRMILGGASLDHALELARAAVLGALDVDRVEIVAGALAAAVSDAKLTCPIDGLDGAYGVLAVYADEARALTPEDANFLDSIANLIGSVLRRDRAAELRQLADEELRSTADRFRMLAENAQDVIFRYRVADEPGYEYMSPACERILGYSPEQFYADSELARRRLDHRDAEVIRATRRGEQREPAVVRWHHPSGCTVWIERRVTLIHDTEGRLLAMEGILLDITARVEHEERCRALEEQLRQSQKLEALGQLAGGIAHDFNNLLLGIRGFGELALGKLEREQEGAPSDIVEMLAAADRAAGLTRQLLAFARRQVLNPEVIDLCETVRTMDSLLGRLIGEHVELVAFCTELTVLVDADRSQIEQVVTNLVVNAGDAMPDGGRLEIDVSIDGDHAVLKVRDDGVGMDEETLARAFDPFFTTKGEDGTGLGLATVHGIVSQSGGRIDVHSEPGRGTTFAVSFPLSTGVPAPVPSVLSHPAGGTETILVVEDNDIVRSIVTAMLEGRGYAVISAANGAEAIAAAAAAPSIDLVLTDLVLPGMGGREASERVQALHPGVRVLYMSGYSDDAVFRSGGRAPGTGFIQKPFDGEALGHGVRDALECAA